MAREGGNDARPPGWSDVSYYLPMRDGVKLATSIYYPGRIPPATPRPAILVLTRYGRATARTRKGPGSILPWLEADFVGCAVDVRGTTSSFGSRCMELGDDEQQDAEEIIDHVAAQPWCNGKIIATGTSYSANTADLVATRDCPGLVAVVPCAADFDWWENFWPGGVRNDLLLRAWAKAVHDIDTGRPLMFNGRVVYGEDWKQHATLNGQERVEDCLELFPTLQPVDEDQDCSMLQVALRCREVGGKHWTSDGYDNVLFRDDKGTNGHSFFGSSASSLVGQLRRHAKPVQYWASWMDANTADEAISRFLSAPEVPSVIIITANNHGGYQRADPLRPDVREPTPSLEEQDRQRLEFSNDILSGRTPSRMIRYYVLGLGLFRETPMWPPGNVMETELWLDGGGQLIPSPSNAAIAHHQINTTATTGKASRWNQLSTTTYEDRRGEDEKLLCFDTVPVERDLEIAGWPVVSLQIATQAEDPTILAYLEDVSPEGRVTYITEGILRLIHREIAPANVLPFVTGPSAHTYSRKDARPVILGSEINVTFKMFATAVFIRQGHRLRLAIAGADADTFPSTSKPDREERFDIRCGGFRPSVLTLPIVSSE